MRIKHLDRFELKCILPRDVADSIAKDLSAYLRPDAHSDSAGQYAITSLYYDTVDYRAYWDKIQGHRLRRKVRLRVYGNRAVTAETYCYVEIKQRLNKSLQKRRVFIPYASAVALCGSGQVVAPEQSAGQLAVSADWNVPAAKSSQGGTSPQGEGGKQAVIEEVHYLARSLDLRPACVVSYDRLAFEGGEYDPGLRVTFDTNLKGRTHALTLLTDQQAESHFVLPPHWCIMEIKINDRIPYWLVEFLNHYRCTLQKVSKYCLALEALLGLLQNQRIY